MHRLSPFRRMMARPPPAMMPLKRVGELRAVYRRAMVLERAFFSGQPGTPSPPPPRLCVVDFDETCTQRDTIGRLMEVRALARVHARCLPRHLRRGRAGNVPLSERRPRPSPLAHCAFLNW